MRHRDDLTGLEGGVDEHLEEGAIHAWLDDALSPADAAAAERHVAGCARCAAAVAEARGLIAGASRILSALDGGLGAVAAAPDRPVPDDVPSLIARRAEAGARRRRPMLWGRAAAAVLVVAAGSALVIDRTGGSWSAAVAEQSSDSSAAESSSIVSSAVMQMPATDSLASSAPTVAMEQRRAAVESGRAAARLVPTVRPRPANDAADLVQATSPSPLMLSAPTPPTPTPMPPAPMRGVAGGRARGAATAAVSPPPAVAQGLESMGSQQVRGVVRDASSLRPLEGVQVEIAALQRATVTDSAGRFAIADVPPGAHTARLRRIGYSAEERPVAVAATGATELAVTLRAAASSLSAQSIVGGDTMRREIAAARVAASPAPAAPALRDGSRDRVAVERERAASSAPAAKAVVADAAARSALGVAGCYRLAVDGEMSGAVRGSAEPALPTFVELDTAGVPTARRLRIVPAAAAASAPSGWRLSDGAAAGPVTLWWRDQRADWSMTLMRVDGVLTGTAMATPTTDRGAEPRRARVRLLPTTCGLVPRR